MFDSNLFVNTFHATSLFLYHLKTSEKQRVSDVFWEYRKETSSMKWVKSISYHSSHFISIKLQNLLKLLRNGLHWNDIDLLISNKVYFIMPIWFFLQLSRNFYLPTYCQLICWFSFRHFHRK